jgi:hypothetical protein
MSDKAFGFRRRCSWCGVQLRGWQINLCRACKLRTGDAGIYLQSGGPPCRERSRWEAEPDDAPAAVRRFVIALQESLGLRYSEIRWRRRR